MLNHAKVERLLSGQSAIARKVFGAVPMREQWRVHQIHDAMPGAGADTRVILGCLQDLVDIGLVRESQQGTFQRVEMRLPKTPSPKPKKDATVSRLPTRIAAAINQQQGIESSPLDLLGELSGEIVSLAGEFQQRFSRLAGKVEEAALAIEVERERSTESVAKLKQLQQLLKSLSLES